MRTSHFERETRETSITVDINLDGAGISEIGTPLNFLNHVLESFSKHSKIDIKISAKGDTEIDDHHTVEDCAICLAAALVEALGDKRGIERFGFSMIPMDDSIASAAVDLGGRGYPNISLPFSEFDEKRVGDVSKENIVHFLETLSIEGKFNLYLNVNGRNDHHKVEACFKALARALRMAVKVVDDEIPSTKGEI